MFSHRIVAITALHVCFTFGLPIVVEAKTLDAAVEDATKNIVRYLKSKRQTAISVGDFLGPPQLGATGGPGLTKRFREAFQQHGIEVKSRSEIGLQGRFQLAQQSDGKIMVVISGSLVDPFGQTLTEFSEKGQQTSTKTAIADAKNAKDKAFPQDLPPEISESVTDTGEVVDLVGATTKLFPNDTDADRQKDLARSIINPSFHLDGQRISAVEGDPYQIEILCDGVALPVRNEDGHAFVSIERDQQYVLRIYNTSPYPAAVFIAIDGLSIFEFSELRKANGRPRYQHYILPPTEKGELFRGWHKTNDRVDSFLVTEYSKSAAGLLGKPADGDSIGTITVRFHAAWDPNGPPPTDEDLTKGDSATGFGSPVRQTAREVRRQIGRLRSSVSIRYIK
jgi:hypothetical protein